MVFTPTREAALEKLDIFINESLSDYSTKRNYDYGPENRSNTSCLSPYISHGVLSESEIIKKALNKYSFSKVEKFIQEVLWRTYWKGWLERRPTVWTSYVNDFDSQISKYKNDETYNRVINSESNIECMNDWISELKETGYLHNHTRMIFASIWIFTLKLPWQLGAGLFLKYLFDGDPASNTLSWRWVGGIQTKGKHYIAQSWNIEKFTNGKYPNVELNESPECLVEEISHETIEPVMINADFKLFKDLIIFENTLYPELIDFINENFKQITVIMPESSNDYDRISENLLNFKVGLITNFLSKINKNILINKIKIQELQYFKDKNLCAIYPQIGKNLNDLYLKELNIGFLYKKLDIFSNKYCNRGYFGFKKNIKSILKAI
ncbi:MAG: FAD-binding domain-containing protein [Thermodesulfobacteriota bacterium]